MPTYEYRRPDGSTFEVFQKISADALTEDPETGLPVTRIISGGAGLQFKGTGFYQTDYVKSGTGKPSESESGKEATSAKESKSDSPSAGSSESSASSSGSSSESASKPAKGSSESTSSKD